jgi:hypothetical protein
MGHGHSHEHDAKNYYLDQLFTIAVCGALGAVAVMLWSNGKLGFLHPQFYLWVLAGGIALLALVVVRAVGLWFEVDEAKPVLDTLHDHEHAHGPAHDHNHGCCGHDHAHEHDHGSKAVAALGGASLPLAAPAVVPHTHDHDHDHDDDHDHGHDHGWSPWRYVVLILPVVLFFLNLPNLPNLSAQSNAAGIGFLQLAQAAQTEERRDHYEGKTVRLTGQYIGINLKTCSLRRFKMSCCAADAVPLDAVIMVDPNSSERLDNDRLRGQWVAVTGRVHFFHRPDTGEYKTAVILTPTPEQPLDKLIEVIAPDPNPYLY